MGLWHIAGKNVKWYNHFEKEFIDFTKLNIQLTLAQHGSELHTSTYTWIFFSNTVLYIHFLLMITFSLFLIVKNTAYNIQNRG